MLRAHHGRCHGDDLVLVTLDRVPVQLAAFAHVGQSIALAIGEVVQALFEAVLPWEAVGAVA